MTADEIRAHGCSIVRRYKNKGTKELYRTGIERFCRWYEEEGHTTLTTDTVSEYTDFLLHDVGTASPVNVGLLMIERLTGVLYQEGLIGGDVAHFAATLKRIPQEKNERPTLSSEQIKELLDAPDMATLKGWRDRALLSVLLGCGLKTSDCGALLCDQIEDAHILGLAGREKVAVPEWVLDTLRGWLDLSGIENGPLFPAMRRGGHLSDRPMARQDVWDAVRKYSRSIGMDIQPRDLRRTNIKLSQKEEADLLVEIAQLKRDIASLRRALQIKANLTPERLSAATVYHWEQRDI